MHRTLSAVFVAAISLASIGAAQADALTTGIINPNGTKQTGGPLTVSHPSTGHYIITLTNYTGAAICLFNAIGDVTRISSAGFGSKTCDVQFTNKRAKAADELFTFYAYPPS